MRRSSSTHPRVEWPDGKAFAFTIFDDPDGQPTEVGRRVYDLLADLGLRTTKAVWPIRGSGPPSDLGQTCQDEDYLQWTLSLQRAGFEIGFHNATFHTSDRAQTLRGLEQFARYFGAAPKSMANHYDSQEEIYWGDARVSGLQRALYNVLTLGKNRGRSTGHIEGHPNFWGDLCRERIRYVRNFVYGDINTLRCCPYMPYHDPQRRWVNYWFAGSEGSNCRTAVRTLSEANQERLEAEGGACILYTHFGHGYVNGGRVDPEFRSRIERLSKRPGWFVPASTLLDYLLERRPDPTLSNAQRGELERRWLAHKVRFGTA
jgi:hypothetical protein